VLNAEHSPETLIAELMDSAHRLIQSASASPPIIDGWSPIVILGHMCDVDEQVWLTRLKLMVKTFQDMGSSPLFVWWEPDSEKTESFYAHWAMEDVVRRFLSTRQVIIGFLHKLDPDDWQATAIHATFGRMDLSGLRKQMLIHDEEHRASIKEPG